MNVANLQPESVIYWRRADDSGKNGLGFELGCCDLSEMATPAIQRLWRDILLMRVLRQRAVEGIGLQQLLRPVLLFCSECGHGVFPW